MTGQSTARQFVHKSRTEPPGPQSVFTIILPVFKRHRIRLLAGFAALLCVDFLQLTVPRILKSGVDSLAQGAATEKTLVLLSGLIILIALGAFFFRFSWRFLIIGFSRLLEHDLRKRLFSRMLSLDRTFFEYRPTGDIMAHMTNDLNAVQMACGMGMVATVDAFVVSGVAIGFMFNINIKLTLLSLIPMPFLIILTKFLSRRLHYRFDKVQSQFSLLTEFARSAISSIRLVKAYTLESHQHDEFESLGRQYVQNNLYVAVIQGFLFPASVLISNSSILIILFGGGYLTIEKSISIGDFVAFVTYLQMLTWPMMAVGWVTNIARRGVTSLRRINVLLNAVSSLPILTEREQDFMPWDTTEHKQERVVLHSSPVFVFNNLTFFYPKRSTPSLHKVTFAIDKKVTAIAGRTGSGKSTLCKLITRMYPVNDNGLFLNGRDINTIPIATVRSLVAYASQEPVLFSDTISANIRIGNERATIKDIETAAGAAAIHEEILAFPDQYETRIGEKGVALSGGQRQRLAIARALVSNRPFLLFDDVFSAVDVETEERIISGVLNYSRTKTIVFVSNRQKLLSLAQEVIVMEQGRIIDKGRHESVIQRCDLYNSMITRQSFEITGFGN